MSIRKEKLPELYKRLCLCRQFENLTIKMFMNNELPGFLHSGLGQEAIPVGVSACLEEGDYIQTTHRGHHDMIGRGADVKKMMAELFAKKTGYNEGKGGSMHMTSLEDGIVGQTGIVGSGPVFSVGVALAFQMQKKRNVIISYFGDGASNEGSVHEALNIAALWDLPVVFVIENNGYAESTPQRDHQKIENLADRAGGYGMDGYTCDGNDVFSVEEVASKAIAKARNGKGPSLINAVSYRIMGHYIGDPGTLYRGKEEVEKAKKRDPVAAFRKLLIEMKALTEDTARRIEKEVDDLLEEAVAFARESPEPSAGDLTENVYCL